MSRVTLTREDNFHVITVHGRIIGKCRENGNNPENPTAWRDENGERFVSTSELDAGRVFLLTTYLADAYRAMSRLERGT